MMNPFNLLNHRLPISLRIIAAIVALEGLAVMGLLAASIFVGRPPLANLWPHPAFSRSITVTKIWEEPYNTHPILGWVNDVQTDSSGCSGTDKYGYRHNGNPSRVIKKDAFKIFILGGSTAYGAGVCNHETLAAHLEMLLQKKYGADRIQVFNAGLGGYYSANEFLKLSTEIAFQEPDLVISLSGTNDRPYADINFETLPRVRGRKSNLFLSPHHHKIIEEIHIHRSIGWSLKNLAWNIGIRIRFGASYVNALFWNKTYMGYLVGGVLNRLVQEKPEKPPKNLKEYSKKIAEQRPLEGVAWADQILEGDMGNPRNISRYESYIAKYLRVIGMTHGVSQSIGADYIFILQPSIFTERRKFSPAETAARENFIAQFARQKYDIVGRRQYFDNLVRKKIGMTSVPWLDFTDIFPDKVNAYVDMNHYSSVGNNLIAMGLTKRIIACDYISGHKKEIC
jgi:hypothetical protein